MDPVVLLNYLTIFRMKGAISIIILIVLSNLVCCTTNHNVTKIPQCEPNPCKKEGRCVADRDFGYQCLCDWGWKGIHCEENVNDCKQDSCENGGTCIDKPNSRFECICPQKYAGDSCQYENQCYGINPCKNGGKCWIMWEGEYKCKCDNKFKGKICEHLVYKCPSDYERSRGLCNLHGNCTVNATDGEMNCLCDRGWIGPDCRDEKVVPNSATEMVAASRSSKTDCRYQPYLCRNGGQCEMKKASEPETVCVCAAGFVGDHCETRSQPISTMRSISDTGKLCSEECKAVYANGICEQQCNKPACQLDGGDCDPWRLCQPEKRHNRTTIFGAHHCQSVFHDGKCDPDCNNAACLFDGQDCERVKCPEKLHCGRVYQNDICNAECNNPHCGFDGGDCGERKEATRSDSFFSADNVGDTCSASREFEIDLVLKTTLVQFLEKKSVFLQQLGSELRVVLRLKRVQEIQFNNTRAVMLKLALSPSECIIYGGQCFSSLQQIAGFLRAGMGGPQPMSLPFVVANVETKSRNVVTRQSSLPKKFLALILLMAAGLVLLLPLIGVLLRDRMRKRVKTAGVWTPSEGYSTSTSSINSKGGHHCHNGWGPPTSMTSFPSLQKMSDSNHQLNFGLDYGQGTKFSSSPPQPQHCPYQHLVTENRDTQSRVNCRKRKHERTQEDSDTATSFQLISEALLSRDGVHDQLSSATGNARLLQLVGTACSQQQPQQEVGVRTTAIGNYATDQGESLLHMAARMQCGTSVLRRLHSLEPSMLHSRDVWGRTPLASAVAADSLEAAELLLTLEKQSRREQKQQNKLKLAAAADSDRQKETKPTTAVVAGAGAGCDEGKKTTALIEAVKMDCQEMVQLLLEEGGAVAVNSLDSQGRSVVHWAAQFNNIEMLQRLSHMKVFSKLVDLKDHEEKSALYLAAADGCLEAAHFIANFLTSAGQKLDSHSPCPRQVALEHGHSVIGELLLGLRSASRDDEDDIDDRDNSTEYDNNNNRTKPNNSKKTSRNSKLPTLKKKDSSSRKSTANRGFEELGIINEFEEKESIGSCKMLSDVNNNNTDEDDLATVDVNFQKIEDDDINSLRSCRMSQYVSSEIRGMERSNAENDHNKNGLLTGHSDVPGYQSTNSSSDLSPPQPCLISNPLCQFSTFMPNIYSSSEDHIHFPHPASHEHHQSQAVHHQHQQPLIQQHSYYTRDPHISTQYNQGSAYCPSQLTAAYHIQPQHSVSLTDSVAGVDDLRYQQQNQNYSLFPTLNI